MIACINQKNMYILVKVKGAFIAEASKFPSEVVQLVDFRWLTAHR